MFSQGKLFRGTAYSSVPFNWSATSVSSFPARFSRRRRRIISSERGNVAEDYADSFSCSSVTETEGEHVAHTWDKLLRKLIQSSNERRRSVENNYYPVKYVKSGRERIFHIQFNISRRFYYCNYCSTLGRLCHYF